MVITAKFSSKCPKCHNGIGVGEQVNWAPGSKAEHITCPPASLAVAPTIEARPSWALMDKPEAGFPVGLFTLMFADGERRTLWIKELRSGEFAGWTFFKFLSGPRNTSDYTTFAYCKAGSTQVNLKRGFTSTSVAAKALVGLLAASAAERDEMGLVYSRESGNCRICGRTLTVPESIESGIGPECAARMGAARSSLLSISYGSTKIAERPGPQDSDDPNGEWVAWKNEFARREREQESETAMAGLN